MQIFPHEAFENRQCHAMPKIRASALQMLLFLGFAHVVRSTPRGFNMLEASELPLRQGLLRKTLVTAQMRRHTVWGPGSVGFYIAKIKPFVKGKWLYFGAPQKCARRGCGGRSVQPLEVKRSWLCWWEAWGWMSPALPKAQRVSMGPNSS